MIVLAKSRLQSETVSASGRRKVPQPEIRTASREQNGREQRRAHRGGVSPKAPYICIEDYIIYIMRSTRDSAACVRS